MISILKKNKFEYKLLKELCPFIRFGLMNGEYFVKKVKPLNILTNEEIMDILSYYQCKNDEKCGKFSIIQRGKKWKKLRKIKQRIRRKGMFRPSSRYNISTLHRQQNINNRNRNRNRNTENNLDSNPSSMSLLDPFAFEPDAMSVLTFDNDTFDEFHDAPLSLYPSYDQINNGWRRASDSANNRIRNGSRIDLTTDSNDDEDDDVELDNFL